MDSLFLAAEAGVRFNPDLLGTNTLNIAVVLGLLVYYGRRFLGRLLQERQQSIVQAITEAETAYQQAKAALAAAQQNLAQAQTQAAQIRQDGQATAERLRETLLAQAAQEAERIGLQAQRRIEVEQEQAVAAIRRRLAELTLAYVTAQLQQRLTPELHARLIDEGIARLGGEP
ncbi:MAG: F0F1 ATP synthase subunit B [Gloeomargarita sp. SKYBB_i_bin120]|nr:F0F1 ATP synthase subunit B [Gloeomargarita sp. SKYG98]MCS7291760.1 F0F1 ATP synthase subunit B [Gloeomargarita sp. SKYB120]MDW8177320.1 F0F1 ATP synthase subunit B [Gloeomargarita sp. SKYBB_i_bin120]